MISRCLLRAKVLQALYAQLQDQEQHSINDTKKAFKRSLDELYKLYIYLLSVPIELSAIADKKLIQTKKRITPDPFLEKKHICIKHNLIKKLFNQDGVYENFKKTFSKLYDSEIYNEIYRDLISHQQLDDIVSTDSNHFKNNLKVMTLLYKKILPQASKFVYYLQDISIYWEFNELDYALNIVLKTLQKTTKEDNKIPIFPMLLNLKEDLAFGNILISEGINQAQEIDSLIKRSAHNWEFDRIAVLDRLIIRLAIVEAKTCKGVPLNVTMNEYIELSKWYSTPKSNKFVNGIINQLIQELKQGGGLIDK